MNWPPPTLPPIWEPCPICRPRHRRRRRRRSLRTRPSIWSSFDRRSAPESRNRFLGGSTPAKSRHLATRRTGKRRRREDDLPVTAPLYAIGRFCSRHHYPVIAVWLIAAVALVIVGKASGDKTNDNLTLPGTGSTIATELLEDNLPEQAYGSNPLAFEAKSGKLTDPANAAAIEESDKRLQAMKDVNSAISPLSKKGIGAGLLSEDQKVAYTPVVLGVGPGELTEDEAQSILDAAEPAEKAGLETSVGAYVGQQLSKPDTGV